MYAKTHISHANSFNIPVSIGLATLAHMLKLYEIYLNTTNYPSSDIGCTPPFWTVLVKCHPCCAYGAWLLL